ncbi:MAG: IS1 family transposase [Firmicutes bacterium]|nr:IS1 family transposase [Bacillota bacterium]
MDWKCGNRDINTLKKLLQRLKKWNVRIYIIDYWKPYAEIIPKELLLQNKKYTHSIERNNSHQRHWFARLCFIRGTFPYYASFLLFCFCFIL